MTKTVKTLIILGVIVLIVVGAISYFVRINNTMITAQERVTALWSQVENQYQRRSDLIPNLVNTVKGYAAHEKSTLESVINARAKATQMNVSFENLNEQTMAQYQNAQNNLSTALGKLMVVSERYPDLKANQNFMQLQAEISGTENRISTERKRFNDGVREYNTYIRTFPQSIIAGMRGFTAKAYFKADEGTSEAPEVNF